MRLECARATSLDINPNLPSKVK